MRNKTRNFAWILPFLGVALWGSPAPVKAKVIDEISLVVNQESMTRVEMDEAIAEFFMGQRMNPTRPGTAEYETAKKAVVDGFVREVLLSEEADREKIEVPDGEVDHEVSQEIENMKKRFASEQEFNDGLKKEGITLDDLKQDAHDKLLRRLKANRVMHAKQLDLPAQAQVTEADVQQYYDQHPDEYERAKFSMILLRVPPKSKPEYAKQVEVQAQGLVKELKGGADYSATAKKYSEDQGSASNGGEIGTMARSEIADPKLAKGVFNIPAKGIGLVRGEEGFYIVKVTSKGKADYESVAPEIKDHLRKEKQDKGLELWVNSLRKNAYIVVDGQVVPYTEPAGSPAAEPKKKIITQGAPDNGTAASGTPIDNGANAGPSTVAGAIGSKKPELYPTLSPAGSFVFYLGGEGNSYGSQDLGSYYGSTANSSQNFPFGFGFNAGLDWALDPGLLIGLKADLIRKTTETVNTTSGETAAWSSGAFAPEISAKLFLPMDESTNFIIFVDGGYYMLFGGAVSITGNSVPAEIANFGGSTWGGDIGGSLEFFLDETKTSSLSLDAGYRLVKFDNLSIGSVTNNGVPFTYGSTLTNLPDGTPASLDMSGVKIGLTVRFYLDKED